MYLWGTERGQRDQVIFGGTQNLLGAAQEQSSARAQAARELCQEHPQRGVGTRRWWASRGEDMPRHGRLPATCRTVPYQPNEL